MPIPPINVDGIIPPYLGDDAGTVQEEQSPYKATLLEMIEVFGTSQRRLYLLRNFIRFRRDLRQTGITKGRQWIDGSFVEFVEGTEPNDIDFVTLLHSTDISDDPDHVEAQLDPFLDRDTMKERYTADAIVVDMDGSAEIVLDRIGFYLVLFSHSRRDKIWKGILSIEIASNDNDTYAEQVITTKLDALEAES